MTVRTTLAAAAALGAMLGAAELHAETVTLARDAPGWTTGGNATAQTVKIVTTAPAVNGTYYAGAFAVTDTSGDRGSFEAWCLDLANALSLPTAYTVTDAPWSATTGAIAPARLSAVKGLFEMNYAALDLSNAVQTAGFQVALWEAVYDDAPNVGAGNFRITHNSAVATAATGFLNALAAWDGTVTQWAFSFFESGKDANGRQLSQNLVSVSAIPVPAGALLLLTAAGLAAGVRRHGRAA